MVHFLKYDDVVYEKINKLLHPAGSQSEQSVLPVGYFNTITNFSKDIKRHPCEVSSGKNYMNVTVCSSPTVQWKSSQTAEPRLCSSGPFAGAHWNPGTERETLRGTPGRDHEGWDPSVQRRKRQCYGRVGTLVFTTFQ